MSVDTDILFSPLILQNITIPNRIIRSATYEGMADANGYPQQGLGNLYADLAQNGAGAIITGFCYISKQGRAMQPRQCGIDNDDKIKPWNAVVNQAKKANPQTPLFMQIAHTGRQTLKKFTRETVFGASNKKCIYFRQKVKTLTESEISIIINDFVYAAVRAKKAGFDGIQIHGAHGYLIHQFLSPYTNNRTDKWADGTLLLKEILESIKQNCRDDFPILLKLSHSDDRGLNIRDTINTIMQIEHLTDAVEISYGTMEYALNIIRGDCPVDVILQVNPMFKNLPKIIKKIGKTFFLQKYLSKIIPYINNYNLDAATKINRQVNIPVIAVGGIRNVNDMVDITNQHKADAISLCRPFICEPDLVSNIRQGLYLKSKCINCNLCSIYCDSTNQLKCYAAGAKK
ncbi:MAG: NADH:flavin oxidoreductase [Phycisphaerae bacterium]|nr:NADH:flavin oxidoreductase [Phycisphaerae bacterium]